MPWHLRGGQRVTRRSGVSFLQHRSPGLDSGHQAWQRADWLSHLTAPALQRADWLSCLTASALQRANWVSHLTAPALSYFCPQVEGERNGL